jgi:hypothetical protein
MFKNSSKLKSCMYINVNLDFAQASEVLQIVVMYLKGCILRHTAVAVTFEA